MEILKGKNIFLRALEPEDLDYLFSTENNEDIWEISSTSQPFSRHILSKYIEKSHLDIYQVNQLRLVISDYKNKINENDSKPHKLQKIYIKRSN